MSTRNMYYYQPFRRFCELLVPGKDCTVVSCQVRNLFSMALGWACDVAVREGGTLESIRLS
jgi:hypothetical protein